MKIIEKLGDLPSTTEALWSFLFTFLPVLLGANMVLLALGNPRVFWEGIILTGIYLIYTGVYFWVNSEKEDGDELAE